MLRIYRCLKELDFPPLMQIYIEGNQEKATAYGGGLQRPEQEFYDYLRDVFFRQPGAFYAVWEESGVQVSALRLEPYADGLLLEALETAPPYRGKGYAKALILAVLSRLEDVTVYSHVEKSNIASLRTHFSCGFTVMADYARYLDGTVTQKAYTLHICCKETGKRRSG